MYLSLAETYLQLFLSCSMPSTFSSGSIIVVVMFIMLTGALNLTHEEFHSRVTPTVLSNVACVGTENELSSCSYSSFTSCGLLNDAGVICQGTTVGLYITSTVTLQAFQYM